MLSVESIANAVLDQCMTWLAAKAAGFLNDFFENMNSMGVELFELPWVAAVTLFFEKLGLALFVTGIVVSVFECAIEYQNGRGSIRDACLNVVKGFMAVGLFATVPVRLYSLSVSLQGMLGSELAGLGAGSSIGSIAKDVLSGTGNLMANPIMLLFLLIMMGYSVIKVFLGNLKRGGILLIQIAAGSLYMFSVPRGYMDGFTQWCKQVVGICLTAFLQSTILTAGLMVIPDNPMLGLGLMLSATEVPRIAGQFGLDSSTRANVMGGVHAAQTAVTLTKTIAKAAVL